MHGICLSVPDDSISYGNNAIDFQVVVDPPFDTSHYPGLYEYVIEQCPTLDEHICINDNNAPFLDECKNTELAHLVEHLVIEMYRMSYNGDPVIISGMTIWDWNREPIGLYHIYISNVDEVNMRQCIASALALLASYRPQAAPLA